jgi:hypothetical protein
LSPGWFPKLPPYKVRGDELMWQLKDFFQQVAVVQVDPDIGVRDENFRGHRRRHLLVR